MPQEQTRLEAGTVLRKRYAVQRVLRSDNTYTVYLIKDLQLKRQKYSLFALKEITGLDRQARYQWMFEGVALRQLQHPVLPRVQHVFNDDKRERVYLVSDYVEGIDLETLRQQPPGERFVWAELLPLFEPLIDVLNYLHSQEKPLVHGDIKPTSIIQTLHDQIMLADPGCLQVISPEAQQLVQLDQFSCYQAPEYCTREFDTRADIYSLGATLYALLTGQVPVDAQTRWQQVQAGLSDPLPLASEIAPDISHSFAQILQRALVLDPEQRFASIQACWEALQHPSIQQPTAIIAPPDPGENKSTTSPVTDDPVVLPVPADEDSTSTLASEPGESAAEPLVRRIVVPDPNSPTVPDLHLLTTESAVFPPLYNQQQTQIPRRRRLRLRVAIIYALLCLLFGTGVWALSAIHGHPTAPVASKSGTSPTGTFSSPQATAPGSTATSPGIASTSTPTLNGFPDILGTYYGNLKPVSPPPAANTTIAFTLIVQYQKQNRISGTFNAPGYKNGQNDSFTGTVNTIGKVKFNVTGAAGSTILVFSGGLNSRVSYSFSLAGNFYSCPAGPAGPAARHPAPALACSGKGHPSGFWTMRQD